MVRPRGGNSNDQSTPGSSRSADSTAGPSHALTKSELESFVPEFNPKKNPYVTVGDWLSDVDSVGEIYAWDTRKRMMYASMQLGGPAKTWYQNNKAKLTDWEVFKQQIVLYFPSVLVRSELQRKLINLKKKPDQSMEEYFHEAMTIASQLKLEDDIVKEHLIQGLPYFSWRVALTSDISLDMPQFLQKMIQIEKVDRAQGTQRKPKKNFRRFQGNNAKKESKSDYPSDFKKEEMVPKQESTVRKRARSRDSVEESEPVRKRACFVCKSEEHLAKSCPKKKDFHVPLKDVEVDGKKLKAFIDLGSSCSIVPKSVAEEMSFTMEPDSLIMKGFGGSLSKSLGKIRKVVKVDEFENEIELHVVPDDVLKYKVMIGSDFFDKQGVKVLLDQEGYHIFTVPEDDDERVLKVESESQSLIESQLKIDQEATVEDRQRLVSLLNKYRMCLASDISELGHTTLETMKIVLKDDKVIRRVPYRIPQGREDILDEIIRDL
ncbi:uncharacterized protein LOC129805209 [Phlebotomus papatasi]|uniref:uncharacterized protein LOC129805209 n=1 Tax=Phlebotomus papatasi TaxID=29031 RepID=UPI0024844ED0|nr:uncharacterized protein LOC129805209 [Phlebotomus papatasi]